MNNSPDITGSSNMEVETTPMFNETAPSNLIKNERIFECQRRYNRYNDVELDTNNIPDSKIDTAQDLDVFLRDEEQFWLERMTNYTRNPQKRDTAIMWLKLVPKFYKHLSSLLNHYNFKMHHATNDYMMLIRHHFSCQYDLNVTNAPVYATHYAKVECLVVDKDPVTGKIKYLVVREAYASGSDLRKYFKFITGLIQQGERIDQAAEREVWEETRIKAKFVGLAGVSNRVNTRFLKDEYIFGCVLHTTHPNQTPIVDTNELAAAFWLNQEDKEKCNGPSRRWIRAAGIAGPENLLSRVDFEDVKGPPHVLSMFTFHGKS